MAITDDIAWFKQQFASDLAGSLADTPISFDLVAALAYQETGDVWSKLRLKLSKKEVLRLCVGDTIDAPQRMLSLKTRQRWLPCRKARICSIWRISFWWKWEMRRVSRCISMSGKIPINSSMPSVYSNMTCSSSRKTKIFF